MRTESSKTQFTAQEVMVAVAARQIRDGELVFVGMRLPLLAFAVAKGMHAPRAVGLFECGLMRDEPAPELLYTMSDPPNIAGAIWSTRMINLMGMLQQGAVQLGMIGGAEVDRFGNVNTSYIGSRQRPTVKLPGSGGAADIASLAGRLLIIMQHEQRRFKKRVDYITSPGYGEGGDWRRRVGLPGGGPAAIITTLGTLSFDPETKEAILASHHPGVTPDEVCRQTGWPLLVSPAVHETPPPTDEELAIIRHYDPKGFWTRP
jgi:glutaconate CoA-transferase subunit B